jgi:hypothetical protein
VDFAGWGHFGRSEVQAARIRTLKGRAREGQAPTQGEISLPSLNSNRLGSPSDTPIKQGSIRNPNFKARQPIILGHEMQRNPLPFSDQARESLQ